MTHSPFGAFPSHSLDRTAHHPDGTSVVPSPVAPVKLSEDALAADFVAENAHNWHYVAAWGTWLTWTGKNWKVDETGLIRETVRQTCRQTASKHDKPHESRRISSHKTINAVERLAASDPLIAATAGVWDQDQMLLNTPSGIVNLQTGEIAGHDPTLMITRLAGASPGDHCARWIKFLDEITGSDHDLICYLQRLCGYCLTGSTSEQVFFFLHGQGANGKSVFLQVLAAVLGDYATTAPLDTFMASNSDRHPTDLAGLRGARMVAVHETETGRSWAESRIKALTGGDPIKARFMHRDFFEFCATFKLMIAGNHRPKLNGVGESMRRRLHYIPFTVTIPPSQRDKNLLQTLIRERDGILGWMLKGCREWRRIGLAPPRAVLDAANEYFDDEDQVGQWIENCCAIGPGFTAASADLFVSWSRFAETTGIEKGSQRSLTETLKQKGFKRTRTSAFRGWKGLALRSVVRAVAE